MSGSLSDGKKRRGFRFSRAARIGMILGVLAVAGAVASYAQMSQNQYTIHWHFTLTITVYQQPITIPAGIGINPALWNNHTLDRFATNPGTAPMHTHDSTGLIHIEATGPANINYSLGYLFSVWGVRLTNSCLSTLCDSNTTGIQMYVNGIRSYEFGNYIPHDHDQVLIQVGPTAPGKQNYSIPYDPILCQTSSVPDLVCQTNP